MDSAFESKVLEIVRDQLSVKQGEPFDLKTTLTMLGADSLDCVELEMRFEEEFDLKLPRDFLAEEMTIGRVVGATYEQNCEQHRQAAAT